MLDMAPLHWTVTADLDELEVQVCDEHLVILWLRGFAYEESLLLVWDWKTGTTKFVS